MKIRQDRKRGRQKLVINKTFKNDRKTRCIKGRGPLFTNQKAIITKKKRIKLQGRLNLNLIEKLCGFPHC